MDLKRENVWYSWLGNIVIFFLCFKRYVLIYDLLVELNLYFLKKKSCGDRIWICDFKVMSFVSY